MINEFSISTNEIIQIILQYLKENNLNSSYQTLQKETGIKDNCLLFSSINELKKNIEQGNWDLVLKEINHMTIPFVLLLELYELIIVELIASKEKDIAKCILYHLSDNFVKEIINKWMIAYVNGVNLGIHYERDSKNPYDDVLYEFRRFVTKHPRKDITFFERVKYKPGILKMLK